MKNYFNFLAFLNVKLSVIDILFALKKRVSYGNQASSYGLLNSVAFITKALEGIVSTKIVLVDDSNGLDAEITKYRPKNVILEAIYYTPEKLKLLVKIHKHTNFICRIHSHFPFAVSESFFFEYLNEFRKIKNVYLASNDIRVVDELLESLNWQVLYLPNVYLPSCLHTDKKHRHDERHIKIGCFGALRPLKNTVQQAIAALIFGKIMGVPIEFHINSPIENTNNINSILKNLRALFKEAPNAVLIEHGWKNHQDFIKLVSSMDIGMALSFSETFCIVAADFVQNHTPIVTASEIRFIAPEFTADPTNAFDIADKMVHALNHWNKKSFQNLEHFNDKAIKAWKDVFVGC